MGGGEDDLQMLQAAHLLCLGFSPSTCFLFLPAGVAEYVQAFDSLLAGAVTEYMNKSREIGSDVQTHVRVCLWSSPLAVSLLAEPAENVLLLTVVLKTATEPRRGFQFS